MVKKEIVGKEATAEYAGRKIRGKIIDETKETIVLKTDNKKITIIKKNTKIEIDGIKIEGKKITKRPEDRIKAC